jgi:hypothetical protein
MIAGEYQVGQVIYVISRKESRVYPVLVVEETHRRTLEGSVTSYTVRLPDKKGTEVPLDSVTERAFTSHDTLRDFLVESATRSINSMVDQAVEIGRLLAPAGDEPATPAELTEEAGGVMIVEMPDGTRARVKMPGQPVQG